MRTHLLGCIAQEAPCPTPTAHKRLEEAHVFWHRCLDNYQEPEAFRVDLNAGIQALRNVTFALQKEMRHLDGFEEWYSPWQHAMRSSPVLRWIVKARNAIVKEGDLVAESTTRAWLVFDYFDVAALTLKHIQDVETDGRRGRDTSPCVTARDPRTR